jgi:AraC family ethanolamine operon transcriptional activator
MNREEVLSISDVSTLLGLSQEQLRHGAERRQIPAEEGVDTWWFPRGKLEHWMAASSRSGNDQAQSQRGQFAIIEAHDLDHYRAQPGNWDVKATQLSPGEFQSRIRCITLPGITFYDNRWSQAAVIRGESPPGLLMMGTEVPSKMAGRLSWCGQVTQPSLFACAAPARDIDFCLGEDGAHDIVLLLDPVLLGEIGGEAAIGLVEKNTHLRFDPGAGQRLVTLVLQLIDNYQSRGLVLQQPGVAALIRSELLVALEGCFSKQLPAADDLAPQLRQQAVHRAMEFAEQSCGRTSALELARAAEVSQRTLEYAFRQLVGMTPGKYLQRLRLNGVHHELAERNSKSSSITETALRWGFSHHGRFSAAYQRLFRELPSETVCRSACQVD